MSVDPVSDVTGTPASTPASLSCPNTTFKIPQADSDPADGPTPDDRPKLPDSTSGCAVIGQQDKADPEDWRTKAVPHREILFVDPTGTLRYRGPVSNPVKAR